VLWRWLDGHGMDWCSLHRNGDGWGLFGRAVLTFDGVPGSVQYGVLCDAAWHTHTVTVNCTDGLRDRHLSLRRGENGWLVMNQSRVDLGGCLDVDLGVTPATNTLPIRRLNLAVGESREVVAAWVRFPALDMRPLAQRYTRLGEHTYRYESDTGFSAELTVDDLGLVISYPQGWERVAAT
jgi:hypothetical protein